MITSPKYTRDLTRQEKDDYARMGYAVSESRNRAYNAALRHHCVWKRIPYLTVTVRKRYCAVRFDLDTLARPTSISHDAPFAAWVKEAAEKVPGGRPWCDHQFQADDFYIHKVEIKDGIKLAENIAAYLRKAGYGATPVDVIDLETERWKRKGREGTAVIT